MSSRLGIAGGLIGRRQLLAVTAGLGVALTTGALATGARAQAPWPQKPVRIVVPLAPGGPTDIQARLIADKLQVLWKQPVVIENRPGAGGTLGSGAVARAAPDGHTLLLHGSAHVMNAPLFLNLHHHPVDDFSVIMGVSYQPLILSVHPSVPVNTLAEFVELVRRQPRKVTFGVAGLGAAGHLAGVLLEQRADIELLTVPFSGAAQSSTALLGGQVQSSFLNSTLATPAVGDKTVRALGSSSPGRWRELPDVPSIAEQGYPGFEAGSWYAILGPARIPDAIVGQIHRDLRAVLAMPDVRERMLASGFDLLDHGPQEMREVMRADLVKWTEVIQKSGLKPR